ncbi:hypothetical protein O0L34_g18307 [Tuta absoluta]|nr:hypothetical protein O0L34_g18307 [Tuta absoluta]
MFKLVVLSAVLAVVAAEPGAILASPYYAPLAYTSTVVAPASTTITKQASSVVHPSPYLTYSTPYFGHFIKKRSAPLFAAPYYAPAVTYTSPLYQTAYAAPAVLPAAPVVAHAPLAYTHFIKKRSAPLLATPYYAPALTYSAPYLHTTYTAPAVLPAAPIVAHAPIAYTHFIKKRSAPLLASTYIAPAATSYQSRVDVQHSAPLITTSYAAAPLTYTAPFLTYFK